MTKYRDKGTSMKKVMAAGQFKATCLKAMDEVMKTQVHLVITKRNVPIVEMVPIEKQIRNAFGWMQGTIHTSENILKPIDE